MSVVDRRSALKLALAVAASGCRKAPPPASVDDPTRPRGAMSADAATSAGDVASSDAASSDASSDASSEAPYPKTPPKETIAEGALALHDWSLSGDVARRAVVLVPTYLAKAERVPLLVLLHGLAETVDEEMGAYAWVRRYGIGEGYAHARAPATISLASLKNMVTPERVAELQSALKKNPFRGMVIACPYTPNIWKAASVEGVLDAYADWIFEVLVPRLRSETPVSAKLGLDGVSLGGYASLGVGLRKLDRLDALGCVQAAIAEKDAGAWADKIEKAFAARGAKPLGLLTSTKDAFRAPVEALDAALKKRGIAHDFRLAIGPHDQPFLRGPGSLEMLLWHDRALA